MQPKRVLHIIGKMDRAGAETMLMNLYRQIDRDSIQFDFVTFTYDKGDYDDEIISMGGKIIPIVAKDPISRMVKLTKFLRNNPGYQIVHAHMLLSNAFHLLAAKTAGVKHRISHSHNTSNGQSKLVGKAYEKWSLLTNRKLSTQKIACGNLAAQYLFNTTEDVLLLPNAVDIDAMIEKAGNSRSYIEDNVISARKDDLGIKIIQVGRLNEVKNHKFTLEIAKQLKKRKISFTILLVGQGPLENELKESVTNNQLDDHVHFLGVRSDIPQLMASSDFMVMPSLYEGFPVVLVESQAVGLKSIISNKISQEVDLGLGLVDFLPITSEKLWVEKLISTKEKAAITLHIKMKMKEAGFDSKSNASKLADLYQSF